ncbi:hAT family C-terminal dimerization region [Phytophthora infestans]|uniref:HAT family C-terminal dimerization region n=1 Tax=Phytophthora infestans TaxID=4787 RepID=A0A833T049_PHYIN|nr:hAT family C-terminal dimerization region [Phytophthora infestans]KAF4149677.1 hAT family C-terminal dimerization region [Phytophthora infestans]
MFIELPQKYVEMEMPNSECAVSTRTPATAEKAKPITIPEYWISLKGFLLLQKVVMRVFTTSCSSAAAERNVSTYKFVRSSVRDSLKEGSGEKLVFTFFNANNLDAEGMALFDGFEDLAKSSSDEETRSEDISFEYY